MPNGVSCAFFAGKNLIYGQKEGNVFKEGIAAAQTARTVDSAAKAGVIKAPLEITGKAAKLACKIVYPLIIMSGIYNTVKADDKVKTGAAQAGGIASMYAFEQTAERGLNSICKKISESGCVKNNKAARAALYVAKGAAFVAASLAGYNFGSKAACGVVDAVRNKKSDNLIKKEFTETVLDKNQENAMKETEEDTFASFKL